MPGKTKLVGKQTFLECREANDTCFRVDRDELLHEPIKFHVTSPIRILRYCDKGLETVGKFTNRIEAN